MMDSVTMENFRCFRERQTVPLAPLTLLVGENSTGKTSFLALIRALAEFVFDGRVPDFKDPPYDLGSFDDIAHHHEGHGGPAASFDAGITTHTAPLRRSVARRPHSRFLASVDVTFRKQSHGSGPAPVSQRISTPDVQIEEHLETSDVPYAASISTARGTWTLQVPKGSRHSNSLGDYRFHIMRASKQDGLWDEEDGQLTLEPVAGSPPFSEVDYDALRALARLGGQGRRAQPRGVSRHGSFASAPVRSHPHRTYDPGQWERDPGGEHIPTRIADLSLHQPERWQMLKRRLEAFGKNAGLFDEIDVRHFGTTDSEPFQLRVRKDGKNQKGQLRNLLDVGYGVSQVLPIVTELSRPSVPTAQFLLQQPEVHLHPSAQAALGTLFCQVAANGRQLIVETHSDHLMDRVRMDVRDGTTKLKPKDVSLLYFERTGLDVTIHPLQFDDDGNLHVAPDANGDIPEIPESYRRFFMEETRRTLGL